MQLPSLAVPLTHQTCLNVQDSAEQEAREKEVPRLKNDPKRRTSRLGLHNIDLIRTHLIYDKN